MGFLDSLDDALKQVNADKIFGVIDNALSGTSLGGLSGVVQQLQRSGFAEQVQSWLGSGGNFPITADQLRSALSDAHIQQIAQQLGLPVDRALAILAEHLPAAVDRASPDGTLARA